MTSTLSAASSSPARAVKSSRASLRRPTALACAGALALGAASLAPLDAHASGLELPGNGGISAGRGGATVARPADPTTIIHNVAGIAALPGLQITASVNLGFFNQCFQRAGTYDGEDRYSVFTDGTVFAGSTYNNGTTRYPRVCNEPVVGYNPNVFVTYRPLPNLAFGVGVYAPHATGREGTYSDRVTLDNGMLAPSPVRYLLFQKSLLVLHLNAAVAWAPVPWLRFGASLQPSYANLSYTTMVNALAGAGQSPDSDIQVQLATSGWFAAGNFGIQFVPTPYLTIGVSSHVNLPFTASGQANSIGRVYGNPMQPDTAPVMSSFQILEQDVAMPWNIHAGVRFALPRPGSLGRLPDESGRSYALAGGDALNRNYDPMRDDVFDVELDFIYEQTSTLSNVTLRNSGTINIGSTSVDAPTPISLISDYSNVWGVRLGGDVNVLPNVLAVRAGAAYESGAQSAAKLGIHIPSFDTISAHVGLSARWRWLTGTLGYAHYFFLPLDASTSGDRTVITATGLPNCGSGMSGPGACQTNRGLLTASHDVLSIMVGLKF